MEIQMIWNNQDGFEKKEKSRGLTLPDVKTYYDDTVIKQFDIGVPVEQKRESSCRPPTHVWVTGF